MMEKSVVLAMLLRKIEGIPAEFYEKVEGMVKEMLSAQNAVRVIESRASYTKNGKFFQVHLMTSYGAVNLWGLVRDDKIEISYRNIQNGRGTSLDVEVNDMGFILVDGDWILEEYRTTLGAVRFGEEETIGSFIDSLIVLDDGVYSKYVRENLDYLEELGQDPVLYLSSYNSFWNLREDEFKEEDKTIERYNLVDGHLVLEEEPDVGPRFCFWKRPKDKKN